MSRALSTGPATKKEFRNRAIADRLDFKSQTGAISYERFIDARHRRKLRSASWWRVKGVTRQPPPRSALELQKQCRAYKRDCISGVPAGRAGEPAY